MDKNIEVVDDFLNQKEIQDLYNLLRSPGTTWFIGPDHSDSTIKNKSFVKAYKYDDELLSLVNNYSCIKQIYLKIKERNIKNTTSLGQIYFNCVKTGDKFDFHTDCEGTSVLVYLNPQWKFWWGSGTQFKKPNKIIRPKPGRAIFFDGKIEHRCIAPNYFMEDFGRLSIVMQFDR